MNVNNLSGAAFGLAVAMAGMTSLADASSSSFTSTGIVQQVSPRSGTVILRDGDAYRLPADVDVSSFSAGQRVHVNWSTQTPSRYHGSTDSNPVQMIEADAIRGAG